MKCNNLELLVYISTSNSSTLPIRISAATVSYQNVRPPLTMPNTVNFQKPGNW